MRLLLFLVCLPVMGSKLEHLPWLSFFALVRILSRVVVMGAVSGLIVVSSWFHRDGSRALVVLWEMNWVGPVFREFFCLSSEEVWEGVVF